MNEQTVNDLYQAELRKVLRRRLRGTMSPTDNVLYFPNDIDVRICPKNGISTLKWALLYVSGLSPSSSDKESMSIGTKGWRYHKIKQYGHQDELPFRKDSFRVAVSRDPIKRFLSACEYIKQESSKASDLLNLSSSLTNEDFKRLEKMSDVDILPDNLDDIIDGVWSGEIQNSHFFTQTYYMQNRGQYDKIFKMKNFTTLLEWLRVKSGSSKQIEKIRSNATSGLVFGKSASDLTEDQKKRIMRIYEEDYDYGWTED